MGPLDEQYEQFDDKVGTQARQEAGNMRRDGNPWTQRGRALVATMAVVAIAACGGDGEDDGAATSKQDWERKHGALLAAFGRDLDAANTTISQGEKQATISTCTQLSDDAKEMRNEVFPVPNPQVNRPLREAVDRAIDASENCIRGGRNPEGAHDVEVAMDQLKAARTSFAEAQAAIAAWT